MAYHPNAYAFTLNHTEYTDFFMAIDDGRQHRYPLHGHPLNNVLDLSYGEDILLRMAPHKEAPQLWEALAHLATHFITSTENRGSFHYNRERTLVWAQWLSTYYSDMTLLEVGQFARLMVSDILNASYLKTLDLENIDEILQERIDRFTQSWKNPQERTLMLDLHEKNMLLPWLIEGGHLHAIKPPSPTFGS